MLTALTKAGKNNEAVNFLEQLAENAVNEQRWVNLQVYLTYYTGTTYL